MAHKFRFFGDYNCFGFWEFWHLRNAMTFENKKPLSLIIVSSVNSLIIERRKFKGNMGNMHNTIWQLTILKGCGLKKECEGCTTPSLCVGSRSLCVSCRSLLDGLKQNTDDSVSGSQVCCHVEECSIIGRVVTTCFHAKVGTGFPFEAEILYYLGFGVSSCS